MRPIDEATIRRILELARRGESVRKIAALLQLARSTVGKYLNESRETPESTSHPRKTSLSR